MAKEREQPEAETPTREEYRERFVGDAGDVAVDGVLLDEPDDEKPAPK